MKIRNGRENMKLMKSVFILMMVFAFQSYADNELDDAGGSVAQQLMSGKVVPLKNLQEFADLGLPEHVSTVTVDFESSKAAMAEAGVKSAIVDAFFEDLNKVTGDDIEKRRQYVVMFVLNHL